MSKRFMPVTSSDPGFDLENMDGDLASLWDNDRRVRIFHLEAWRSAAPKNLPDRERQHVR